VVASEAAHASLPDHNERSDFRPAGEEAHCRAQQFDPRIAKPLAKALRLADIEPRELGRREILEVSDSGELAVVGDHGHAIGAEMYIDFDEARAELDGGAQGPQRVFREIAGISTAGHHM
jgi:hypothetical protein